jgi:hypothetical protein
LKYSASVRPDSQIGVPFVAGNIQPIDKADVGASVTVDHSLEFPVPTDGSQLPNNENGKSNLIFISLNSLFIYYPSNYTLNY